LIGDELLQMAWATIAREAIVDTFLARSGLQLKLSGTHAYIYLHISMCIYIINKDQEIGIQDGSEKRGDGGYVY
jgi:hypothetical protein